MVDNLDVNAVRRLAIELLRRQPAVFADVVNGEFPVSDRVEDALQPGEDAPQHDEDAPQPGEDAPQPGEGAPQPGEDALQHDEDAPQPGEDAPQPGEGAPQPGEDLPQPGGSEVPPWCNCGNCRVMPTQLENKCCCTRKLPCMSTTPLFQQLVLDGNVLDIAMRYREDVLALDDHRNNENFRHMAYRQYILWQHGRLGQGNHRVVPSSCVLAIRSRYPSPNGVYTGYRPSRL